MSKKYLYGNLNQDVVRATYGGSTSDSLIINVDNDNMVISGEVIWDGAIGEIAHKAYPGDKGAENRRKIGALQLRLEDVSKYVEEACSKSLTEVESAVKFTKESCDEADKRISELTKNVTSVTSDTELLSVQLNEEINRSQSAEEELRTLILNETATLHELINDVENSSSLTEVETAINVLREELKNESNRAISTEKLIEEKIEVNVVHLNTVVSELETIVNETSDRLVTTDTKLQELCKICDELLTNNDILVQKLDDHTKNQITQYNAITVRLDQLEHNISNVDSALAQLRVNTSKIEESIAELTTAMLEVESEISNEQQNRDVQFNSLQHSHAEDVERLDKKILDTNSAIVNIEHSFNQQQSTLETIKNEIDALDRALKDIESKEPDIDPEKITEIQSQLIETNSIIKLLQSQCAECYQQLSEVLTLVNQHDVELSMTATSLKNFTSRIDKCSNDIIDLSVSAEALQHELEASLAEQSQFNANTSSTLAHHKNYLDEVDTSISHVNVQINNINQNINSLDSLLFECIRTNSSQSTLISELQTLVSNSLDKANFLQTRIETIFQDISKIQEQLSLSSSDIQNVQNDVQNCIFDISKLTTVTAELEKAQVVINNVIDSIDDKVSNTIHEVEELSNHTDTQLRVLNDTTAQLHATSVECQLQIVSVTNKLTELTAHFNALNEKELQLRSGLSSITTKVETLDDRQKRTDEAIYELSESTQAEYTKREKQWSTLESELRAEVARSIKLDEQHSSSILNNTIRITNLQTDLVQLIEELLVDLQSFDQQLLERIEDTTELVYTTESKLNLSISRLRSSMEASDAKLRNDIDKINKSATTQAYVDDVVKQLRNEIYAELETTFLYEFIDGGNAPI